MKKFTLLLLLIIIFALVFSQAAFASLATTAAQESTSAATREGYEDGMVRGQDISAPIAVCFITVCACIIYGISLLRKHKDDTL